MRDILLKKKGNIVRVACHLKSYKIAMCGVVCVCAHMHVCTFVSVYLCLGTDVEGCTTGKGVRE